MCLPKSESVFAKAKASVPIADRIWKYALFRGSSDIIKGKSTWGAVYAQKVKTMSPDYQISIGIFLAGLAYFHPES
jgi:hypothetical protein